MYTPIGGKVLLRELAYDKRSGLILPGAKNTPVLRAEVVEVGPGYLQSDGRYVPCQVKKGDHVYVTRQRVGVATFNGFEYLMTDEANLLVVIDKEKDKYEQPVEVATEPS